MNNSAAIERAIGYFGGRRQAGEALGVTRESVRKWIVGESRITAERAIQIEQLTHRKVLRSELRPDLYEEVAAS